MGWKAIVAGAMVMLAGCTTGPNAEAEKRAKAWAQIGLKTDVTVVGANRLRIETSGPLVSQISQLEIDTLARAAGEAVRRGASRFALLHIDYDQVSLSNILLPSYDEPSTSWVGTYEDLLAARASSDPSGSLDGRLGIQSMTVVVRLLSDGEEPNRPAFNAEETYLALVNDRIERRNIRPNRYLDLPFIGD